MRIVCISDTHTLQEKLKHQIPEGDVLIHSGDITNKGDSTDILNFGLWSMTLPHKHKICIAGNHDFCFENRGFSRQDALSYLNRYKWNYLQDSEVVIDGVKFYGSPWQPEFSSWAFNLPRGERLALAWAAIPDDTDVLITHCPPADILDLTIREQEHAGCEDLKRRVMEVKPMLHVFGHIHEGYGVLNQDGITFANSSLCDLKYNPINKPLVFDFDCVSGELSQVQI